MPCLFEVSLLKPNIRKKGTLTITTIIIIIIKGLLGNLETNHSKRASTTSSLVYGVHSLLFAGDVGRSAPGQDGGRAKPKAVARI